MEASPSCGKRSGESLQIRTLNKTTLKRTGGRLPLEHRSARNKHKNTTHVVAQPMRTVRLLRSAFYCFILRCCRQPARDAIYIYPGHDSSLGRRGYLLSRTSKSCTFRYLYFYLKHAIVQDYCCYNLHYHIISSTRVSYVLQDVASTTKGKFRRAPRSERDERYMLSRTWSVSRSTAQVTGMVLICPQARV